MYLKIRIADRDDIMFLEKLKDKVVLVTGASRGIGRAIALSFGSLGSKVAVNYYNSEEEAINVKEEIESIGGEAVIVRANTMDAKQVERMINFVVDEFGKIDVLVNNVGEYQRKDFLKLTREDWDYIMEKNLYTAVYTTKEVLPHMIKQKWGRVINIASTSGVRGSSNAPHYSAAKGALISLTKALAKAYGKYNITFNAIAPGPTDTELLRRWFSEDELKEIRSRNPLGKLGKPEDIGELAVAIAANDHLNGQVIVVSGGDI